MSDSTLISDAPIISVTIATFNRADLLEKCLFALEKQTVINSSFEVIVCDSNSSDGTRELIEKYNKNPHYLLRHYNTINNLAAKRNLGISKARGRFIIFLDDDCVPANDMIQEHLNACISGEGDLAAYCGEVRYPSDWVDQSNYYRFRDSRHFGFTGDYKRTESLDYRTIVVMNMSFEKDLFLRHVGAVNEAFIGYGAEDQDLGWRMQEAGYKIVPIKARIYHHETTSSMMNYGSKIRRSSRDGMSTLLRVNRSAAINIVSLRLIDAAFPSRSLIDKICRFTLIILILLKTHALIGFYLKYTDKFRFAYAPFLYRLMMAMYHVQGSLERNRTLTAEAAERGWDQ